MKAIVQNAYGSSSVLASSEVEKPSVKDGEVLVRIRATSVNAGDYFSMRGSPWVARFSVGFPRPKNYILGWDAAGTVEAVGSGVTEFAPGDDVYGSVSATFAEYVAAPQGKFAPKPPALSYEEAAAVPSAGLTALQALRNAGGVSKGCRVLINGASGGVGSFAVQIAKAQGGTVTGVCSSRNEDAVRRLGADRVVDYTAADFTQGDERYDIILDLVGNRPIAALRRVLAQEGRIQPNTGHGGMGYVFRSLLWSLVSPRHAKLFVTDTDSADLFGLTELIETEKLRPLIDRTYRLDEMPDAMAYAEQGHVCGKVVITVP